MARAFVQREQAAKYTVAKGDTLARIVAGKCEPGVSWQELARYNWATEVPEEVNRALIEIVGCSRVDPDPSKSLLDPALGTNPQILIPKIFKQSGLATDQTHTITVRKRLPAPAIRITRLDKWFIPGAETCDIDYALEGVKQRADKVDFEVYASHYCLAMAAAAGDFLTYSYTEVDIPVRKRAMSGEQRPGIVYRIRDWKGESEAADGALKPRPGKTRYVNVAFSPYTILLRYYKNEADRKARIRLEPFWVEFEKPADSTAIRPKDASLWIRWRVTDTRKLKHGQIIVWDRNDRPVFRKALGTGDLSAGDHDYFWREGKTLARPAGMPYRVQIQAHTDMHEDDGLALAAAHTEVRLWCHAGTGKDPKDYWTDPVSLELALAPWLPPPEPPRGSVQYYKLILARAGYHPGPIDDDQEREEFKTALAEFQRSWAKLKRVGGYERLAALGKLDQETKNQFSKGVGRHRRPLFGDSTTRRDLADWEEQRRLGDLSKDLIVWVDDRHCYTSGPGSPSGLMAMNNYRGKMDIGDERVKKDRESIPRPWIPVEVSLPLLSKHDPLEPTGRPPRVTEAMRRAVGPIRVDWTFKDLEPDPKFVPSPDKKNHRARRWIQEIVKHNCPEKINGTDCGGIRPAALDSYYRAALGFGVKDSLQPWLAYDDSGAKTICTLVHDDLGQDEQKLYESYVGKAGVYLRPSRIAGDGYVFCAQVSFKPLPHGQDFPNRAALERRYPQRPLGRTTDMRVWRKTCYRGYIGWLPAPQPGWEATMEETAALYRPGYVHFVHPGHVPQQYDVKRLVSAEEFEKLVDDKLQYKNSPFQSLKARYTEGYIWPYLHLPHYGLWPRQETLNEFETWLRTGLDEISWDRYCAPLMMLLIQRVEERYGRLRGHLLVEFATSPPVLLLEYACEACARIYSLVANDPTSTVKDPDTGMLVTPPAVCLTPGCAGNVWDKTMHETGRKTLHHGFPLPAIGLPLGGCWLFLPRDAATWAHEIGHHRHLEHAKANDDEKPAPGAKDKQHDSARNPNQKDPKLHDHQRGWDRFCIMSYDSSSEQAFCGKCLLRNRGWAVEVIKDPDGSLEDP